jgi:hypothetical protein
MMVLLEISVECSTEIAMTALRGGSVAMGLLPKHHLVRLILLDARAVHIR